MGRYNFRPQRVHETVSALIEGGRLTQRPAWYNVVGDIPPPELLTRRQPLKHVQPASGRRRPQPKKASKMYRPTEIGYEEDELRREFFKDHPWELARPRIITEGNGVNGTEVWDTIRPKGTLLSGESVVQRQLYLMDNHSLSKAQAYDVARTEFYNARLKGDVERRVAHEEALHYGAYFGKNRLEIGMELEDAAYESWKTWADAEITASQQLRLAGSQQGSATSGAEADVVDVEDNAPLELGEAETTQPASPKV